MPNQIRFSKISYNPTGPWDHKDSVYDKSLKYIMLVCTFKKRESEMKGYYKHIRHRWGKWGGRVGATSTQGGSSELVLSMSNKRGGGEGQKGQIHLLQSCIIDN